MTEREVLRMRKLEQDNKRLLEALEDLVGLANAAMSDANRSAWGEYNIVGELRAAREVIAKAKKGRE